jgi:hypothetical protein
MRVIVPSIIYTFLKQIAELEQEHDDALAEAVRNLKEQINYLDVLTMEVCREKED